MMNMLRVSLLLGMTASLSGCGAWLTREVNARLPPVSPLDNQMAAIHASQSSLGRMGTPTAEVHLAARHLEAGFADALQRVDQVEVVEARARFTKQQIVLSAKLRKEWSDAGVDASGRLRVHAALAADQQGLVLRPSASFFWIDAVHVRDWRVPGGVVNFVSALVDGLLARINGQLKCYRVDVEDQLSWKVDLAGPLAGADEITSVTADSLVLLYDLGATTVLVGDDGVGVLVDLAPRSAAPPSMCDSKVPLDLDPITRQRASPADVDSAFTTFQAAFRGAGESAALRPPSAGSETYVGISKAKVAEAVNVIGAAPKVAVEAELDFAGGDTTALSVAEMKFDCETSGVCGPLTPLYRELRVEPVLNTVCWFVSLGGLIKFVRKFCRDVTHIPCEGLRKAYVVACNLAEAGVNELVAGNWGNVTTAYRMRASMAGRLDWVQVDQGLSRLDLAVTASGGGDASGKVIWERPSNLGHQFLATFVTGCNMLWPWDEPDFSLQTRVQLPEASHRLRANIGWNVVADSLVVTVDPEEFTIWTEPRPNIFAGIARDNGLEWVLRCGTTPGLADGLSSTLGLALLAFSVIRPPGQVSLSDFVIKGHRIGKREDLKPFSSTVSIPPIQVGANPIALLPYTSASAIGAQTRTLREFPLEEGEAEFEVVLATTFPDGDAALDTLRMTRQVTSQGVKDGMRVVVSLEGTGVSTSDTTYLKADSSGVYSRGREEDSESSLLIPLPISVGERWTARLKNGTIEYRLASIGQMLVGNELRENCATFETIQDPGGEEVEGDQTWCPGLGLVHEESEASGTRTTSRWVKAGGG